MTSSLRVEGMDGDVEADLVVALAGAAMGHRVGALAVGDLDEQLGDERPGQGGGQRVDALVEGVGLQVGPDELAHEALPPVDDVGAAGAGLQGSCRDVLAHRAAADVHGQGDDLDAVLLLEPGDGDRCIQAARIGEHDLLHCDLPVLVDESDTPWGPDARRAGATGERPAAPWDARTRRSGGSLTCINMRVSGRFLHSHASAAGRRRQHGRGLRMRCGAIRCRTWGSGEVPGRPRNGAGSRDRVAVSGYYPSGAERA